ncbi:prepilin-type N-terminal cleavage/methylation domain-containing protein [Roseateles asaccharophilus]|uniref:Prepilin-type N-terminal cleavage/methylation domain-containing protein n=1 Tax=Roseateles asaccharophilus TaxID=582607 RepID=A0ABU2A5Q1_9BURK|nr:prepilin-type N-terminal cleavage/methylation domain-containing protein [Roseateles asaccharophilus]MDR7332528.1 prepilin-type N-terminal cleavage/methylation domain-containing protein [Roseateles asaccharophilus]
MNPIRIASRGLGLVEVMIGLTVLGVLLAVAVPSMLDLLERRRVVAVGLEVANVFNFAKSQANISGDRVTVHLEKDTGTPVSCVSVNLHNVSDFCKCYREPGSMCGRSTIQVLRWFQVQDSQGVSFAASGRWAPDKDGQFTISRNYHATDVSDVEVNVTGKRTGAKLKVEINAANRVRTCTPDGSINGFPTC